MVNDSVFIILRISGMVYLYMKTIERSHQPAKLWERVKLSKNYEAALKQVVLNVYFVCIDITTGYAHFFLFTADQHSLDLLA